MAELCVPPPIPPLDNTLGAAFIGNLAAAVLYGFTSLQTFMYFDRYNDGRPFKLLVAFLWVLDTLHLIFISHTLYIYSVTNFSNVLAMENVTWSIMAHVFVTGVSDVTVRGMFTHRVWLVSNKNLLLIPAIMVPSLVTLAGSIVFPIRGLQIGTYAGLTRISAVLYLSFAGGVLADVVIAAALSFSLARRKTGIRGTDSMIRILIAYSVNTGILTSLCALLVLICYATMPSNFVFIAFYFVLPKRIVLELASRDPQCP
ncbi:hypothetical protein PHLGIDRAFT_141640 [Phlebiopsis gigantea 11061_1 CR5-6]|uniref:DUF6534 domain-containing protein n=1 Tax=Phlebiopsis gigantea (strain 11061_1 CR5-6) TaxID=745531 RepID=A0A0C3S5L1_PHLG1|nr:hypothetical protein PHLGIDRAFT_141640 [Phlebiopsis gigantea 11061_1 CR5-6]